MLCVLAHSTRRAAQFSLSAVVSVDVTTLFFSRARPCDAGVSAYLESAFVQSVVGVSALVVLHHSSRARMAVR